MTTTSSATATIAPNDIHDQFGWRRRGDQRKIRAIAAVSRRMPSGHLAMLQ